MADRNKEKDFKVAGPNAKQPIYRVFKALVMRRIFKKPQIINLAGEVEDKCIVVANHSAKSGPPSLDLYFPKKTAKWGHYGMFGSFKERKAYLRDVLYIQKMHMKPGFGTSFKAGLMGWLSPTVYRGMRMLPSYPDSRLLKTLRISSKVLDQNMGVMVFPENSNEGYEEELKEFFPGFVMLAEKYYRETGEDLPVYPVYYSVPKHIMVIGKPLYVQELAKEGLDRYAIAQRYCEEVNKLFYEYVQDKKVGSCAKSD